MPIARSHNSDSTISLKHYHSLVFLRIFGMPECFATFKTFFSSHLQILIIHKSTERQ